MRDAVILSACRTPIGRFQGGLGDFTAPQLGSIAITGAVQRAGIELAQVDEVILGCVLQGGLGQNPARQAARGAGIPDEVGSFAVNKVCGSGLKAVMLAAQAVRAGDAEMLVAGGMESMSNAPYFIASARGGIRLGHGEIKDMMVHDGLWDPYGDVHMGETGELVAEKYEVTREDQDAFAAESHRRAAAAAEAGGFRAEIVPVEVKPRKGDPWMLETDEGIRGDASTEGLGKMRPAFRKDGTVTAGNASQLSDGASALVIASAEKAEELGLEPLARIVNYATGGLAPEWVMMAPEVAVSKLCDAQGCAPTDFDAVEINEAFSSAAVALTRRMDLDAGKVNASGGAVALGHPIGASGARILTTLLHRMAEGDAKSGLATLCLGGGNAVALSVERS